VIPFYFEEPVKRMLTVVISPKTCTVDLYDRDRDTDSKLFLLLKYLDHDISDTILHILHMASKLSGTYFNED
jgi:hypothetical protein